MNKGFTLIELLVVIAIIGILSALAVPNFFAARERARDTQRKSDLKQIQKAMELYKDDQTIVQYPTTGPGNTLNTTCGTAWGSSAVPTVAYMPRMPCDAAAPTKYYYQRNAADSLNYTLQACLENPADSDRDATIQGGCTKASYTLNAP